MNWPRYLVRGEKPGEFYPANTLAAALDLKSEHGGTVYEPLGMTTAEKVNRPTVVTLCGSTRFMQEFYDANMRETLAGRIVLSVGMSSKGDCKPTDAQKLALDELHKRKIDLSDEILVLNVGGYVGNSTRSEIEYAKSKGKAVRYLEPVDGQQR